MVQLRSGKLSAYTSVGYGEADLNAKTTSDLKLLGKRISPETFTNRYAPLLLSAQKKTWALFWLSLRKSIIRPIYIELSAKEAENADELNLTPSKALAEIQAPIHPGATKDTTLGNLCISL